MFEYQDNRRMQTVPVAQMKRCSSSRSSAITACLVKHYRKHCEKPGAQKTRQDKKGPMQLHLIMCHDIMITNAGLHNWPCRHQSCW